RQEALILIETTPHLATPIRAKLLPLADGENFHLTEQHPFVQVTFQGTTHPDQGWKLHVSATPRTAVAVFAACWPILADARVTFKVMEPGELAEVNGLNAARSQVGKFLTVYPGSDTEAVQLAVKLHEATTGMAGPRIPSDRPLAPGSLVHYRYGGFVEHAVVTHEGELLPVIHDPSGRPVPDRRDPWFQPPPWVIDPFAEAGAALPDAEEEGPIGARYRVTAALKQAARGGVYLAEEIGVEPPGQLLIKEGRAHIEVDKYDPGERDVRDVRALLRAEFMTLQRVAGTGWVPEPYDLFEQGGNAYIVREYINGKPMRTFLKETVVAGRSAPALRRVVDWAAELARICVDFHAAGLIIRDLTPNNVLVTDGDRLRMIDLELVWPVDGSGGRPVQMATPGYACESGQEPTVADDIYAFGATLFFLLAREDAYLISDDTPLLPRQMAVLDHCCPELPVALRAIVERCLQRSPAERFPSAQALADAVGAVKASLSPDLTISPDRAQSASRLDAPGCEAMLQLARGAGDELIRTITPDDRDYCWPYQKNVPRSAPGNLQYGTSGAALLLIDLYERTREERYLQMAARAADWVYERVKGSDQGIPGLHFGNGAAAWFFLRMGLASGEERYLRWADEVITQLLTWPMTFVDITHGTAGIALLLLALARATQNPRHQMRAAELGDSLLNRAEPGKAGLLWAGLNKQRFLGFAHGVAGVGYCLLELGKATGASRFTDGAEAALTELLAGAYPLGPESEGWNWPKWDGSETNMIYWCNGAPGVGQFLIEAYRTFGRTEYLEAARRAAVTTWERTTTDTLGQCHGVAGNAEFLLDMYRVTRAPVYLRQALSLAGGIAVRSYRSAGGARLWPAEGAPDQAGYMTGYAGIASLLLRLSAPEPYRREWVLPIARLVVSS
ncbi:MAG: pknA1, partial [Firmicutes bacterium]|nr:pknA1 [Bacillota bacterium]